MPKTYTLSTAQAAEAAKARSETRDKQVDKRLRAVQMRGEGKSNKEIAEVLETSTDMVSRWASAYAKGGIEALMPRKRTGRRPNMSRTEEAKMLEMYMDRARKGQIIEIGEIKAEYEARVGHTIGGSQIYYVLKRHGWRKVMPRSRHPEKASSEAVEASKKLTLASRS